MKTGIISVLLATAAAAMAQEPLSEYLDTAFGWLPGEMPEHRAPAGAAAWRCAYFRSVAGAEQEPACGHI